jgi:hypothetical protein
LPADRGRGGAFGDLRTELLTRLIEAMISVYRADYEHVRQVCDRGLALARQLGARRFEAELMALQGHAIGELGGIADAQVLLQHAAALALEVARTYCGPWCLAVQALHMANEVRARELLAQGEAMLAEGCVSHNHIEFRRLAMEFNLRHGDLAQARRHAAALRDYTKDESLAWCELIIGRAEYLADCAENPARPTSPPVARRCCAASTPRISPGCAAASEGDAPPKRVTLTFSRIISAMTQLIGWVNAQSAP